MFIGTDETDAIGAFGDSVRTGGEIDGQVRIGRDHSLICRIEGERSRRSENQPSHGEVHRRIERLSGGLEQRLGEEELDLRQVLSDGNWVDRIQRIYTRSQRDALHEGDEFAAIRAAGEYRDSSQRQDEPDGVVHG